MNTLQHYDTDSEKYTGLFIRENNGFVISPDKGFDATSLFAKLKSGEPLVKIISSSPRICKDGQLGAKFHFYLADGLKLKFASEEEISLIRQLKMDTSSILSLQLKQSKSFSISPSDGMVDSDLNELHSEPIVISLSAPKFNERNQNEFWHENPSFRISASRCWLIERPKFKKAA
jgi:hypothetical protein